MSTETNDKYTLDSVKKVALCMGTKTCFHRIQESTKAEFVSVGDGGNILRWAEAVPPSPEQKWLIVPAKSPGTFNIYTVSNGELMSVGSTGNILRWAATGQPEQDFRFVNEDMRGAYNIQEMTRKEFVSVGDGGNILRWAETRDDSQRFMLKPIDWVDPDDVKMAALIRGEDLYTEDSVPDHPTIARDGEELGDSEKYLLGIEALPSVFVCDPNYTNKVLQVKDHPYYYLKHRRYWEKLSDDAIFEGVQLKHTETVHVGSSTKDTHSIETTIGVVVKAELSGELGSESPGKSGKGSKASRKGSATLSAEFQWQRKESDEHEVSHDGFIEVTDEVTIDPKTDGRIVHWQLVDDFSLYNSRRELVTAWNVRTKRTVWDRIPKHQLGAPVASEVHVL